MSFVIEACIFVLACATGYRTIKFAAKVVNKLFDKIEKKL